MNRRHSLQGDELTDLPAERPGKFELAAEVKTAKALDIEIAQSRLLRVDEVIR
jgi:hypothetical protein